MNSSSDRVLFEVRSYAPCRCVFEPLWIPPPVGLLSLLNFFRLIHNNKFRIIVVLHSPLCYISKNNSMLIIIDNFIIENMVSFMLLRPC